MTLRLEPLPEADAVELAAAAGDGIDRATAERIAHHAGGNPVFIIETTGMLLDGRHAREAPELLLPATVQAVVASRIDHLPEDARALIRRASVFAGSAFDHDDLLLVGECRREALEALVAAELLVPEEGRPGVWRFRHEVLRDVAYESLAKRERLRLHLRVAEGLAAKGGSDRYPQVVAYHLEQAARASRDLDPGDRTLADRAMEALAHAGDGARYRIESRTAIDRYERALALAGPEEAWGVREARILSRIGECRYWLGEYREAVAVLSRALELSGDDVWTRAHAPRFLGDIVLNVDLDLDRAEELFREALSASRELRGEEHPYVLARTLLMAGWVPYWRDDLAGARAMFEEALAVARAMFEEALAVARARGDRWGSARALTSLASVASPVGRETEALALAEEALALGGSMGDAGRRVHRGRGPVLRRELPAPDVAAGGGPPSPRRRRPRLRRAGGRWELAAALADRGNVHRLAGRLDEAEADLVRPGHLPGAWRADPGRLDRLPTGPDPPGPG